MMEASLEATLDWHLSSCHRRGRNACLDLGCTPGEGERHSGGERGEGDFVVQPLWSPLNADWGGSTALAGKETSQSSWLGHHTLASLGRMEHHAGHWNADPGGTCCRQSGGGSTTGQCVPAQALKLIPVHKALAGALSLVAPRSSNSHATPLNTALQICNYLLVRNRLTSDWGIIWVLGFVLPA